MSDDIKKGLLGIVVDETEVSKVMPEINSLTYRGYAAQDLCEYCCLLYTSPSPRDISGSRMPSSA